MITFFIEYESSFLLH